MSSDELNEAKFELEQKRFALEEKRFKLDEERAFRERRFLTRNAATLITGLISLATIAVSASVAYNAYRQTDQTRIVEASKLDQAKLDSDKKWRNDALQYTTAQYEAIYSGETKKQERILSLMEPVFPREIFERILDHLKEAAPTKDGPNVWARGEQKIDKQDLASDTPAPVITLSESLTVDALRKQLYSPERRSVSNALIEQYDAGNKSIVSQLVVAVLPEEDNRSYRTNLYIAYALARTTRKWEGTNDEVATIASLRNTMNYKDPTFAQWVDKALANAATVSSR